MGLRAFGTILSIVSVALLGVLTAACSRPSEPSPPPGLPSTPSTPGEPMPPAPGVSWWSWQSTPYSRWGGLAEQLAVLPASRAVLPAAATLSRGMRGDLVVWAQQLLIGAGQHVRPQRVAQQAVRGGQLLADRLDRPEEAHRARDSFKRQMRGHDQVIRAWSQPRARCPRQVGHDSEPSPARPR